MSVAISGINSAQVGVEPSLAATSNQKTVQPVATASGDTVKISQAAQVTQLSRQGESASQIAKSLGISVTTVNLYLGIVAQTALDAAVTVATAAPASSTSSATTSTSAASAAVTSSSKSISTTAT